MLSVLIIAGAWLLFSLCFRWTHGVCRSTRDLTGKTALIIGGNRGIGLEAARDLARRKARVIIACRDQTQGKSALENIITSTDNENVILKKVDLTSLTSAKCLAHDILQTECRLDILILNAGTLTFKFQKTEDGLETTMAVNYYSYFLITNLLIPLLKKSAPSRVLIVSSDLHRIVNMDFKNINSEKYYFGLLAYSRSKLAGVLFMRELHRRLKNTGVTANALHPGAIATNLTKSYGFVAFALFAILTLPFMRTTEEGAQTLIYCSVAEELDKVSGKYFSECAESKLWVWADNRTTGNLLWEHSEKVTGLNKAHENKQK